MNDFTINLTDQQIQKMKDLGLDPVSGTLPETKGVVLSYVVSNNVATITVVKKPGLVPIFAIKNHLNDLLSSSQT